MEATACFTITRSSNGFPSFLPKEVEKIKDQHVQDLAMKIQRIPVKIMGQKKYHVLSSRCYVSSFVSEASGVIARMDDDQKKLLTDLKLLQLFQFPTVPQNTPLLLALGSWYDEQSDCFVIGSRELTFSPNDVALILGLPNRGEQIVLTTKPYGVLDKHKLKKEIRNMSEGSSPVKINILVLHLLCSFFFPSSSERMPMFFDKVSTLEHFHEYNWPEAIYSFLMGSFKELARRVSSAFPDGQLYERPDSSMGYIYGCTHMLIIWFLEHTKSVAPHSPAKRPRLMRWSEKISFTLKELGDTVPSWTDDQVLPSFDDITPDELVLCSEVTTLATSPPPPPSRKSPTKETRTSPSSKRKSSPIAPATKKRVRFETPSLPSSPTASSPTPSSPPHPTPTTSSTPHLPLEFLINLENKIFARFDLIDSRLDDYNNRLNRIETKLDKTHYDIIIYSQSVGEVLDEISADVYDLRHPSSPASSPSPSGNRSPSDNTLADDKSSPQPTSLGHTISTVDPTSTAIIIIEESSKDIILPEVVDKAYPVNYPGKSAITEEQREIIHRRMSAIPSRNDPAFHKWNIIGFRDGMDALLTTGYIEDCHVEAYAKIMTLHRQQDSEAYSPFIYISPALLMHAKNVGSSAVKTMVEDVTRKNLADIPLIFMPICYSQHWFLLVGLVREKTWLLHDSLHNPKRKETARNAIAVLQNATAKKVHAGFSRWNVELLSGIPQQNNSFDCGVFVIKYMEHIAKEGVNSWSSCADWQSNMPRFRAEICAEIFKYFVD